ncbi:MAG: TRAP transporter substrate-binding protein [Rhodospirillaceae bacterium]|nr:TRAP transporter substrate-binding protein [Rhodospirillaceae bacterium]MBT7955716.1 TRAP transporter substrate-binding protein [Rhodospirillaceae bacterium]
MLIGLALVPGAAQAETVLRFSNWIPPTHPLTTNAFSVWAKKIETATKGRVKVNLTPPLGKPPAHYDLVKSGVADIAWGVHGYNIDRFTLEYGMMLPFYAKTATASSIAFWRTNEKFFAKAKEYAGVKLMGLDVHGPAMVFTTKKRIRTLADMKNLKIRIGGGIISDISKALNVTPFFAPAPKAYEVLSKGVADGIFFPAESVASFKIDKIIKNALIIPGGLYRSSNYIIMNQAKWNSLSKQDQAAINSVSGEALARLMGSVWDAADKVGHKAMQKNGINVYEVKGPFLAEMTKKLAHLEAAWIARAKKQGVDGRAALAFYKAEIAKLE